MIFMRNSALKKMIVVCFLFINVTLHAQFRSSAPFNEKPKKDSDPLVQNQQQKEEPSIKNYILVVVNRDLITFEEFREAAEQTKQRMKQSKAEIPPLDILIEQTLEALIFQRLQMQEADLLSVNPSEEVLMDAIKNIAQQNRLSESDFLQQVAKDGLTYDQLKQIIRQDIVTRRLKQREIEPKINIANVDIEQFLQKKLHDRPLEYNLSQILIAVPENASSEQIDLLQQKAAAIRSSLVQGSEFSSVAQKESQDDKAIDGGNMGWRTLKQLPGLFSETIAALKEGEFSSVVRSPRGFHLIRLNEIRLPQLNDAQSLEEMFAPVSQVKVRHILLRSSSFLTEEGILKKLAAIRIKIQTQKSSFGEMATLFSQDESASKEGILAWAVAGDFVPEFESAIDNLPLNQLSQPIKTPYGWHLIEVLERKKESLPISRIRDIARQKLREEKTEELFAKWMDELRDQAIIERRYEINQLFDEIKLINN